MADEKKTPETKAPENKPHGKPGKPGNNQSTGKKLLISAADSAVRTLAGTAAKEVMLKLLKPLLAFNHPSWYATSAAGDAKQIQTLGMNFAIDKASSIPFESEKRSVAAISVADYINANASALDGSEMFTPAIENIWRDLCSRSGRNPNYDSDEVAQYITSYNDLVTALAAMLRAYEMANSFSVTDSQLPDGYSTAIGMDVTGFQNNAANFRTWFSIRLKKLFASYPLPSLYRIHRSAWMSGSVFTDYSGDKPTYMIYRPAQLHVYDAEQSAFAKFYINSSFNNNDDEPMAYETVLANYDGMFAAFRNTYGSSQLKSDMKRVYGIEANHDVYNALFGRIVEPEPQIHLLDDNYQRTQWQNTTPICAWRNNEMSSRVEMNDNTWRSIKGFSACNWAAVMRNEGVLYLETQDSVATTSYNSPLNIDQVAAAYISDNISSKTYINSYSSKLSQTEQVSISRLVAQTQSGTGKRRLYVCGTEVVTHAATYTFCLSGNDVVESMGRVPCGIVLVTTAYPTSQNGSLAFRTIRYPENMLATFSINSNVDYGMKVIQVLGATTLKEAPTPEDFVFSGMYCAFDWSQWAPITTESLAAYHGLAAWALYTPRGKVNRFATADDFTKSNS